MCVRDVCALHCAFVDAVVAAGHLHGLFLAIHPPVGKTRILFSLEKYQMLEASLISLS